MGELLFVGLGLGDERDVTPRAIDALRSCRTIFAEEYTSVLAAGSLERLSKEVGRPILRLGREEVEAERRILDALSSFARVGFLSVGDPFVATTHVALRLAAEEAGHGWRYFPNASIVTAAAGFLGLITYRFGRTVSLPMPAAGFAPTSPVDRLAENLSAGAHTLVLLDLRPEQKRYLLPAEALEILRTRGAERAPALLAPERRVAVVARVGTDSAQAWYGSVERLVRLDFGPPLHSVVVPAEPLHFQEKAALRRYEF